MDVFYMQLILIHVSDYRTEFVVGRAVTHLSGGIPVDEYIEAYCVHGDCSHALLGCSNINVSPSDAGKNFLQISNVLFSKLF